MQNLLIINPDVLASIQAKLAEVLDKLSEIKVDKGPLSERWLSNKEVCKLLGISERLLQDFRDKLLISFSQHGHKIWYKASDIEQFLIRNYTKALSDEKGQTTKRA